jgi:hypothetical protein
MMNYPKEQLLESCVRQSSQLVVACRYHGWGKADEFIYLLVI